MKKYSLPQVCLLRSDGPSQCYAIREVSFDEANRICEISEETLSPKCSSSDELRRVVLNLLQQAHSGPVTCGAPQRAVEKAELESWLKWIGKPVVEIFES